MWAPGSVRVCTGRPCGGHHRQHHLLRCGGGGKYSTDAAWRRRGTWRTGGRSHGRVARCGGAWVLSLDAGGILSLFSSPFLGDRIWRFVASAGSPIPHRLSNWPRRPTSPRRRTADRDREDTDESGGGAVGENTPTRRRHGNMEWGTDKPNMAKSGRGSRVWLRIRSKHQRWYILVFGLFRHSPNTFATLFVVNRTPTLGMLGI